jgi:hypothetical protein
MVTSNENYPDIVRSLRCKDGSRTLTRRARSSNVRPQTLNVCSNMQRPLSDIEAPPFKIQRSLSNTHPPSSELERPPSNIERPLFKVGALLSSLAASPFELAPSLSLMHGVGSAKNINRRSLHEVFCWKRAMRRASSGHYFEPRGRTNCPSMLDKRRRMDARRHGERQEASARALKTVLPDAPYHAESSKLGLSGSRNRVAS